MIAVRSGMDSSSAARRQKPLEVRNESGRSRVQIQRINAAEDSARYKLSTQYGFFFKVHNGLGCSI